MRLEKIRQVKLQEGLHDRADCQNSDTVIWRMYFV